jgi:PAS domain S-box-containing protein
VTPFGPPREITEQEHRVTRPGAAATDRVRRAAGPVRAALAVLLVAVSPLAGSASPRDRLDFGLIVGLLWIPVAGVAAAAGRRHRTRSVDLVNALLDVSLLALFQALLSPPAGVVLVLLIAVVASSTYLAGRWLGVTAGVAGLGAFLLVDGSAFVDAAGSMTLALYPAVLVVVAWLVDSVALDSWQASAGLERSQEKSDAILTGVGEAVVVTGPSGRIEQWNRAATMTFAQSVDEVTGRPCAAVLGLLHEVRELDCSQGCALLRLGGNEREEHRPVDVEVWRRSPTGSRQPLLASVSPVVDAGGEIVEVVHSFRDITRLKQADEAKTLFLATASHELKTPLTVIRGFAQMLLLPEAHLNDEERRAALRAIDVRAGQLTSIVDRLLMSSRIEAGRIELVAQAVQVGPILQERADAYEGATGREIAVALAGDLPDVHCDPDAFTTVVDHLLDNAVKYSPNGGVVTLAAAALNDGVEVVVADEGVGMTPEQSAHCFDRFWQAEATDVRRFGGTGIGLYIVRSLVEGMGGSIAVTSAPGAGSVFRVTFLRSDRVALEPGIDDGGGEAGPTAGRGEASMIREYMRQLGVPIEREPADAGGRRPQ